MKIDVNGVVKRIELQLGAFEKTLCEARRRIDYIEQHLDGKIEQVRKCIKLMEDSKDVMMVTRIVDILNDIEQIIDKLNSVDMEPINVNETSLESLVSEEYAKIEHFIL